MRRSISNWRRTTTNDYGSSVKEDNRYDPAADFPLPNPYDDDGVLDDSTATEAASKLLRTR